MNETWRFLKFVLFSASAGLIEIGSFALLNELLDWPYWPSYLIALTLSVLWNFTLNRKFTFRSAADVPRAMLLVAAYYAVFTPCGRDYRLCLDAAGPDDESDQVLLVYSLMFIVYR